MGTVAPKITICLLTYNRAEYAHKTLRSVLDKIVYDTPVAVHIASDGDTPDYIDSLRHLAGGYANVSGVTQSNSEQHGYGANFNLATQVIHGFSDYVLPLEDDWELLRELDLNELIYDLESCDRIACVRLGYLSFTQQLLGEVLDVRNRKYLLLNPGSPEPHCWCGHPRLETVDFQRAVGEWPKGISPGQTEFVVAHRLAARCGVAWPMDLVHPRGDLFAHIGTIRSTDV